MSLLLSLVACLPTTPEAAVEQLEAATVDGGDCSDSGETCEESISGLLAVTRSEGESSVDLTLTFGEDVITVHSPSGADLSAFVGAEASATVKGAWMMPTSLEVRDVEGLVYVVEAGDGVFNDVEVAYGAELGTMVNDADYQLTFHEIDITTDQGVVSVVPGEVTTIVVAGVTYRFAAIAAYEVDTLPDGIYADCGGELPMLSYELLRVESPVAEEKLERPEGLEMARYSGCG